MINRWNKSYVYKRDTENYIWHRSFLFHWYLVCTIINYTRCWYVIACNGTLKKERKKKKKRFIEKRHHAKYIIEIFALLFTNVIYNHGKMCFIYIGLFSKPCLQHFCRDQSFSINFSANFLKNELEEEEYFNQATNGIKY